jgi:hypothetical protein
MTCDCCCAANGTHVVAFCLDCIEVAHKARGQASGPPAPSSIPPEFAKESGGSGSACVVCAKRGALPIIVTCSECGRERHYMEVP